MIRVATIGTNFITDWFLAAARHCPNIQCEAVYSRSLEKARAYARQNGVPLAFDDLLRLAQSPRVDAVYIASPNALHFKQAELLLSHGKHVLCEKTIVSNLRELEKLERTAREHGAVLMEAMRNVHTHGFRLVSEALPRLGTLRLAHFEYCQYSSRYDKFKNGVVENAFNPALSNGALMDIGVYCVRPLVMLFGAPDSVRADGIRLSNGADGAGVVHAGYGGMRAELTYSKISNGGAPSQIQGEEGTLLIEGIGNPRRVTLLPRGGPAEELLRMEEPEDMSAEIADWAALVEAGDTRGEDLCFARMELALMDEIRRQLGIRFPADDEEP